MRFATSFLLLGLLIAAAGCSKSNSAEEGVRLRLALATHQKEFQIGEIIPVKLTFSTAVEKYYVLNEASYSRSGRMAYETFKVTPADGAVDPLRSYFNDSRVHMGGGLTNLRFLTQTAWSIELNLNEWVHFTSPGDYRLIVSSERVEKPDKSVMGGTSPAAATSNQITLKIRAADPEWQQQV